MSDLKILRIKKDVLAKNDDIARANRDRLAAAGAVALNFVSSPGAGKTTLLEKTLTALRGSVPMAVIEGDQETDNDARRIAATGAPVVQVNTVSACHLDAAMVDGALSGLSPGGGIVFIENVGNLVCPASYDLGEAAKIVVISVTEGDDKPEKYPKIFRISKAMVINKIDLLPHVDFDPARAAAFARKMNPDIKIFHVSARTGEGLQGWHDYLLSLVK
ncbi:MAG: hydrogenase nickel incorporation protein HypB [Candidatus Nitrospinota bacterium M3_3B_026]